MTILPGNPNKITSLIIWCLFALFGLILLCGCSPERKLHRAEKKLSKLIANFPELVKTDTVWKDTTVFVPSKEIKGEAEINKDFNGLTDIIDQFKGRIDSLTALQLKTEIKNYTINRPILLDTITIDSLGMHVRIFELNGKLHYTFKADSTSINVKYAQGISSVSVKPLNRKERFVMWVADNLAWIVLISMGLFWVLKKILKGYNPIEQIVKLLPKVRE